MVACEECVRANPPTRMMCLYCGTALPRRKQSAAHWRPTLKKLEEWEQGFEAASLLRLDVSGLKDLVLVGRAMPIARVNSADEARLIVDKLRELGLNTEVFPDEVLARRPLRVRAFEFEDDALGRAHL